VEFLVELDVASTGCLAYVRGFHFLFCCVEVSSVVLCLLSCVVLCCVVLCCDPVASVLLHCVALCCDLLSLLCCICCVAL